MKSSQKVVVVFLVVCISLFAKVAFAKTSSDYKISSISRTGDLVLVRGNKLNELSKIVIANKYYMAWKKNEPIVKPLWSNEDSLVFKIPSFIEPGVFWCKFVYDAKHVYLIPVGVPVVTSIMEIEEGRKFIIAGKNFVHDPDFLSIIQLKGNGKEIYINPKSQTNNILDIIIPKTIPSGTYSIALRNGDLAQKYWVQAGAIQVK